MNGVQKKQAAVQTAVAPQEPQPHAAAIALNLLIAVLAIVGCVLGWRKQGIAMLEYYTVESNLLGALACGLLGALLLRQRRTGKPVPGFARMLKLMAVCCLMVTFLVVILVLAPTRGGLDGYRVMLTKNDMLYHHLLCPLLSLLSFFLYDSVPLRPLRAAAIAAVPTAVYALVTAALNALYIMDGPYPFLHVYEQPFILSCLWFVLIVGGAFGLAALLARSRQIVSAER